MVFAYQEFFRIASSHEQKNLKKEALGPLKPSPDLPEFLQNRTRSGPRHAKIGRERQQTQEETQNAPNKRPRAKNSANMAPRPQRSLEDL